MREVEAGGPASAPRPTAVWHVLTAIWALMALAMSASITPDLLLVLAVLAFGGLLGLIWTVQMLRVLLDREARGRLAPRAALAWAACPTTGLLLAALVSTQWPFALRVKLSEPALLRLVEEVEGGRTNVGGRYGAGRVPVEHAWVEKDCVALCTGTGGFLMEYGLLCARDGKPPASLGACRFRHLFGPWYTYELKL